ncbi:MAG TPA: T9SS type A sorting domain-containing protein [Flavobacteriales bacterium]|nr:T9SS type A sorting domain-containing protein [Flavobacteriales bacterium]
MNHLYTLSLATCIIVSAAQGQQQRSPDGVLSSDRAIKSIVRIAPIDGGERGTAPANDECAGAVTMTVGTGCDPTNGTLEGATETMPPSTCSGFTSTTSNDVWYKFTATAASTYISVTGDAGNTTPDTTGLDPVLEVFSGDCSALVSLGCVDGTLGGGTETGQLATTAGTTYYYRIYYWAYGALPISYGFTTCVYSLTPPANDDCAAAASLTPSTFCHNVTFSGTGATESQVADLCNGSTGTANDDIWFSFVATQTTMTVGATGSDDGDGDNNTGYDAVIEVFDACGGTALGCADATFGCEPESVELTGLVVGTTYYFRVFHWYAAGVTPYSVDVCVVEGGGVSIGIQEVTGADAWSIFPNPTEGAFSFTYSGANTAGTIEVIDMTGRVVMSERTALAKGTMRSMDLGNVAAGTYTVRVTAGNERSEQRLMVK